jgi:hypothetical protein
MANPMIVKMIELLLARTKEAKVKWEETATEGVFQMAFPLYVVQLAEISSAAGQPTDYVVRVFDQGGSLVEQVADTDLQEHFSRSNEAFRIMRDLYNEARRSAKGVNTAIRSILDALEDDDIPF